MATLTHRHHRPAAIPKHMLAAVLVGATLLALVPFAIVLSGLESASETQLDWILGGITVFVVLFPLAVWLFSPRRDEHGHRHHREEPR